MLMAANLLTHEKSPYLLYHSRDPVQWYPWGDDAFEKARLESKPVFLSIGYFACHWCHVMARESFQDPLVSECLNHNFVAIKVDREERPDLDAYYMKAVTGMTGGGGWPLSVFLTPEGKPFYGGTYFPPVDRDGLPAFLSVLQSVGRAWNESRGDVEKAASYLVRELDTRETEPVSLSRDVDKEAFEGLARDFDNEYGGFGSGVKFPTLPALLFLTRYSRFSGDRRGLDMTDKTLESMASGGLFDHVAGGFHRYATDREWRIPHFEKMLYDQALGIIACVEAFQITGKEIYRRAAEETIEFVLSDLRDHGGGFYSSLDADSPLPDDPSRSEEGAYYLWTENEIVATMGKREAAVFLSVYALAAVDGPGRGGVLYRAHKASAAAMRSGMTVEETGRIVVAARQKLRWNRSHRPMPQCDRKILADWNGLMISALSIASRVLDRPVYATAAAACADFVFSSLHVDGILYHRYFEGTAGIEGMLDDYAYVLNGLIDLYQATFEPRWLSDAIRLGNDMHESLYDREKGGFFFSVPVAMPGSPRQKDIVDNVLPSGNAMAVQGLLRLYLCTRDESLKIIARETLDTFAGAVARAPYSCAQYFVARYLMEYGKDIVIAEGGDEGKKGMAGLKKIVDTMFVPEAVVTLRPFDERLRAEMAAVMPSVEKQQPVNGRATAFVCGPVACGEPVTEPGKLRTMLSVTWERSGA